MTTPATDANPILAPLLPGYDDNAHQKNVALRVKNVATDATTGVIYGDLGVDVTVSLPADQTINIDKVAGAAPNFAQETGGNLATLVTNTANIPAKGAAATTASTPVNIASDQVVPVKRSAVAAYTLASTATTSSSNSGDITVGPYTEISLDINTTAQTGTNPTIQFFYERKGADGIYYVLWQSATLTAATNTLSTSIGAGMAYNQSLGSTGRLRWVIGGSATPGYTFSANITGK